MEDLDRCIVGLLSQDGRMSFTDLGKATGLSTSAVHQRVRRLEERGAIQGYRAVINHNELGLPLIAFISVAPPDPGAPAASRPTSATSRRSRPATRPRGRRATSSK